MRQINEIPTVLDSHGSYALEFTDVISSRVVVNFQVDYKNAIRIFSIQHRSHNGHLSVRLDAVLNAIFEYEPLDFEIENPFEPLARLIVSIEAYNKTFKVVNAALPFSSEQTMEDLVGKRLGHVTHAPLFVGYPKTTVKLRNNNLEHIINSKGCRPPKEPVDSTVNITLTKPDGSIVTGTTEMQIEIPDDSAANGLYSVEFKNNEIEPETEVRTFEVVNAGDGQVIDEELDIVFERNGQDLGDSVAFEYTTFLDTAMARIILPFTPNSGTKYRFGVIDQEGNTYEQENFSSNDSLLMNPYLLNNTEEYYVPKIIGGHSVFGYVIHEGRYYEVVKNLNVTAIGSIDDGEDDVVGSILIAENRPNIFYPIFIGDSFSVRPMSVSYRCTVGGINLDSPGVLWKMEYPNGTAHEIDSSEGLAFIMAFGSNEPAPEPINGKFGITESGSYKLSAQFNYGGQVRNLQRNLSITFLPL